MQDTHDLWVARRSLDLARVRPLEIAAVPFLPRGTPEGGYRAGIM